MAVVNVPSESVLRLRFNVGTDGEGNPQFSNKNLYHIKPDALDADLHAVAQALAGLVETPLDSITRIDTGELIEQV